MTIRRFEFIEGTSSKFWEIEQDGVQVLTRYGRIGNKAASTTKLEATPADAAKLTLKLIAEKTKKGYLEVARLTAPLKATKFATGPDYAFVRKMQTFGEAYVPNVGDVIENEDDDIRGKVTKVTDEVIFVRDDEGNSHEMAKDAYCYVSESPTIAAVWETFMRQGQPDGVAYSDLVVPAELQASLTDQVTALLDAEAADYHPGSGTRVRDLVHPSLYPYVDAVSVLSVPAAPVKAGSHDRFGRVYEASKFQWLPSQFAIGVDGDVTISSYINNLSPTHVSLYTDLAKLFGSVLPLIESVVGYVDGTKFFVDGDPSIDHEGELPEGQDWVQPVIVPRSLRGRELQVIPKIVEYKLEPGETHEGVWHVEGMSHEHIVATCVYVLDRDEHMHGGAIAFKRGCTIEEAGMLFWGMDQSRPAPAQTMVEESLIPLGRIETPKGRAFVFPNSHIHKLTTMGVEGDVAARRRVIVFWIVDPDVPILSTRDVPAQQSTMTRAEALAIRLQLMEERKRHKENFNVRTISLCEH